MNSAPLDLKTAMLERIRADASRKVWTPSAVLAREWMLRRWMRSPFSTNE